MQDGDIVYQGERWLARCWQSATRYYTAEVAQDLFGAWVLRCSWGGLGARSGNIRVTLMADYRTALLALEALAKRRKARGYHSI